MAQKWLFLVKAGIFKVAENRDPRTDYGATELEGNGSSVIRDVKPGL